MADPLCIMAVGAHPPDVISRAGGTLAKHARRGDVVVAVSLTDGTRHMNPLLSRFPVVDDAALAEAAKVKQAEMRAACAALGATHCLFLSLRDSPLATDTAALRALVDVIREYRPDVLLSHHPQEAVLNGHIDHGDAGRMVLRAYMLAYEIGFESPRLPHMVNSVWLFNQTLNTDGPGLNHLPPPTHYVDISDVIEVKNSALRALSGTMPYSDEAIARLTAQSLGREQLTGVDHAEGFCALHTPVVDYFERRTKGRWLGLPDNPAWQNIRLWPSA